MKIKRFSIFIALFFLTIYLAKNTVYWAFVPSISAQEQENEDDEEKSEEKNETKTQEEKIQDLKSRLATKVAEIRESQKGALSGNIKNLSDDNFVLVTKKDDLKVDYNEDDTLIEELVGEKTQEKSVDDLQNGNFVTVFGLIDESDSKIDAKRILIKPQIITITGIVVEIDSGDFIIDVQTVNNELFTVDYEKATTTVTWNGEKIVKSGFSKIAVDDRIHVRATPIKNEEKKVTATRILHLPLNTFEQAEEPTPTPEPEEVEK